MNRVALFPGSFDPVHNGHLEVLEGARRLFDHVVVAAFDSGKGGSLFDLSEREEMLKASVGHMDGVSVTSFSSLVVDIAREVGATVLVRGLRAVSDFETELQMAQMNRHLADVDTVFIPTSSDSSFLASRLIREVARYGGDVSQLVPAPVAEAMNARFPGTGS